MIRFFASLEWWERILYPVGLAGALTIAIAFLLWLTGALS